MSKPPKKDSGPPKRAATLIAKGTSSSEPESLQVEKLLKRFANTAIPDLWHYAQELKEETHKATQQFGHEVLEFWHLTHALQRALWKRAERSQR